MNIFSRFVRDESGATAIEYGLIAALIAVVIISILAKPSTGDPTRYTTAYQFFQLPHALLAVSIMVTFEPSALTSARCCQTPVVSRAGNFFSRS